MTDYVILECTNTMRLQIWAVQEQIPLWIPMRKEGGKAVAVLPGYAFIPTSHKAEFLSRVPPTYRVRVFKYNSSGEARTCDESELLDMQQAIDSSLPHTEAAPLERFKIGQRVRIVHGPFKGTDAVIEKIRGHSIRLVISRGYISVPCEIIAPV